MSLNFFKKLSQIRQQLNVILRKKDDDHGLQVNDYLERHLYNNPKYLGNKRLNRYEYAAFSQYGEDGIIAEIFNRIGTTNKYFIEFGVENGLECNTINLLYKGWQGLWIDGNENSYKQIQTRFANWINERRLTVKRNFIIAENIEQLFNEGNAPKEPDLLSIDIDYNDYYIWEAIRNYNPRVVILEYNAIFRPDTHFVVHYDANFVSDGTSYFGASLRAFEQLGAAKGYCLVGCSYSGVNAFFVRQDLVADLFEAPFTAENHYEPCRYFLLYKAGHPRNHISH